MTLYSSGFCCVLFDLLVRIRCVKSCSQHPSPPPPPQTRETAVSWSVWHRHSQEPCNIMIQRDTMRHPMSHQCHHIKLNSHAFYFRSLLKRQCISKCLRNVSYSSCQNSCQFLSQIVDTDQSSESLTSPNGGTHEWRVFHVFSMGWYLISEKHVKINLEEKKISCCMLQICWTDPCFSWSVWV